MAQTAATQWIAPRIIKRDGEVIAVCANEADTLAWMHRQQGQSVDWATRFEGYSIEAPAPWSAEDARHHAATAAQCLLRHDHPMSDRSALTRENCGACVLQGYRPRGGYGDPEVDAPDNGPNYAGWVRIYVEAGQPIPKKWRPGFLRQLATPDNLRYAEAVARSVATFGVRFA